MCCTRTRRRRRGTRTSSRTRSRPCRQQHDAGLVPASRQRFAARFELDVLEPPGPLRGRGRALRARRRRRPRRCRVAVEERCRRSGRGRASLLAMPIDLEARPAVLDAIDRLRVRATAPPAPADHRARREQRDARIPSAAHSGAAASRRRASPAHSASSADHRATRRRPTPTALTLFAQSNAAESHLDLVRARPQLDARRTARCCRSSLRGLAAEVADVEQSFRVVQERATGAASGDRSTKRYAVRRPCRTFGATVSAERNSRSSSSPGAGDSHCTFVSFTARSTSRCRDCPPTTVTPPAARQLVRGSSGTRRGSSTPAASIPGRRVSAACSLRSCHRRRRPARRAALLRRHARRRSCGTHALRRSSPTRAVGPGSRTS